MIRCVIRGCPHNNNATSLLADDVTTINSDMISFISTIISLHSFIYVMPQLIDNPLAWLSLDREQDAIFGDRNNPTLEYALGKAILWLKEYVISK